MAGQRTGRGERLLKEQNAKLADALTALTSYVRHEAFDVCTVRDNDVVDRWKSPQLMKLLDQAEGLLPAAGLGFRPWHPMRTAPKPGSGEQALVLEAILPDEAQREQTIRWSDQGWVTDAGKAVRPAFWRRCAG